MRTANLVLTALGTLAAILAARFAWTWRRLPLTARPVERGPLRRRVPDALRAEGTVMTAGALAGILVLGVGGRLVMRILAATSGDAAQGRLTEADELVGRITFDGSLGFVLFIGLGGGLFCAVAYLAVRPFLPDRAGPAGLVVAVLATGTLGIADPMSPDNLDFAVLSPTPLAIALLLATAALFATSFTALAARLDRASVSGTTRIGRLAPLVALPLAALLPPFAVALLLYGVVRVFVAPLLATMDTPSWWHPVKRTVMVTAALVTAGTSTWAATQILTA